MQKSEHIEVQLNVSFCLLSNKLFLKHNTGYLLVIRNNHSTIIHIMYAYANHAST